VETRIAVFVIFHSDSSSLSEDTLVDTLLVRYLGIPRESVFKAILESCPVHSLYLRAVHEVLEGRWTHGINQNREVIRADCRTLRCTGRMKSLTTSTSRTLEVALCV
jgi:hypothetical protein